jgi:hypothetical protein
MGQHPRPPTAGAGGGSSKMSERDRLGRQDHSLIFKTGVVMSQWLPSHRVINLNCVKSSKYQPGR